VREKGSYKLNPKSIFGRLRRLDNDSSERTKRQTDVVVIDESDPSNFLSNLNFLVPFQYKGLNPDRQFDLANFYIKKFALTNRGPMLDVGYGNNVYTSLTFMERGIPAYALELRNGHGYDWEPPTLDGQNEEVQLLSGDIAYIGNKKSAVKNVKFGTILMNGSWDHQGKNSPIQLMLELKQPRSRRSKDYVDQEKDRALQACVNQLTEGGIFGVISSRFALDGGQLTFSQLPAEKLGMIDLFDRLKKMGAKKIYLLGLSPTGFSQLISTCLMTEKIESIREQLREVSLLPLGSFILKADDEQLERDRLAKLIGSHHNDINLNQLTQIDAIFAEF
jgi:hypothetical protein